jgi:NAD+ synthase (glutamine-hydrolysing)
MHANSSLRIALAQINPTVGDLDGNYKKIIETLNAATAANCHLVAFPELTITGYPPEDLLLRQKFIQDQRAVLDSIIPHVEGITAIVGFVDKHEYLYNSAAVIQNQKLMAIYHKIQLPNYSVFDEERYFEAGESPLILSLNGIKIGVSICEDIWIPNSVTETQAFVGGADVLLNISASPYSINKGYERTKLMQSRATHTRSIVAYCNLIGGQDELVFDGQSLIVGPNGNVKQLGAAFSEELIFHDIDVDGLRQLRNDPVFIEHQHNFQAPFSAIQHVELDNIKTSASPIKQVKNQPLGFEEEVYNALLLGIRDYVHKNGFHKVVFGLSGGIDSALVAALAADALGPENVNCIGMPSHFSSKGSVDDSDQLAQNFGIHFQTFEIRKIYDQFIDMFKETFSGLEPDVTEENLQARIRGDIVMALSNKFNWLALATGNKSEVSVGYCTIYGDMVGGFSPLKDVTKMMVYRLSEYRNYVAGYDIIPQAIIDKAPSAELRPDQKDEDSLPPYDELDSLLELYVEQLKGQDEIVSLGFNKDTTARIARLVNLNEYKRRQAAPGVKITPVAFGKDRRMPITNGYRER